VHKYCCFACSAAAYLASLLPFISSALLTNAAVAADTVLLLTWTDASQQLQQPLYYRSIKSPALPTNAAAAAAAATNAVLLPTWRWKDPSQQLQLSEQPAEKCPWHSYCPGGVAGADKDGSTACPNNLWTRSNGAKSLRECRECIEMLLVVECKSTECPQAGLLAINGALQ
jgi:hypothetical protein